MSGNCIRYRLPHLLLPAAVFLALTGCESIQQIDRAAGEWAREHKAQRAAEEEAARQRGVLTATKRSCRKIAQSLYLPSIDADTAYVRLKRYFGFHTQSEAQKVYPYPEWLPQTNYRHETLPGVRYAMSEEVVWPSATYGPHHVWLTLDIEREKRGSRLRWSWCEGADGWEKLGAPAQVQRHLAQEIEQVARGGGR